MSFSLKIFHFFFKTYLLHRMRVKKMSENLLHFIEKFSQKSFVEFRLLYTFAIR